MAVKNRGLATSISPFFLCPFHPLLKGPSLSTVYLPGHFPGSLFNKKQIFGSGRAGPWELYAPTWSSPTFSSLFTSYITTRSPSTIVSEQLRHFLCCATVGLKATCAWKEQRCQSPVSACSLSGGTPSHAHRWRSRATLHPSSEGHLAAFSAVGQASVLYKRFEEFLPPPHPHLMEEMATSSRKSWQKVLRGLWPLQRWLLLAIKAERIKLSMSCSD